MSRTLTHHVFLSFRGADVRKNLLTHILGEFQRKGITPFIDNEMERGVSLGPELLHAIKSARITIVIFSMNYASSSWCLDELVEIMKCKDEFNQKVMTIFHQVKPTDVRHQKGDFGKAFEETCAGKSEEVKRLWKKALTDAANIHGDGLESDKWKSEVDMITTISIDVLGELQSTQSRDFDHYVGLQAHMTSIDSLLCLDTNEVRMIGIWGPSGIGKTTISRVLLNKLSPRFQLSARVGDIKRRHLSRHDVYDAKAKLQKELFCELLKHKSIEIPHLGVAKERFQDKKVLVILDDVNELWQLQATVHYPHWFGGGSRIIIITEDRRVLEQHGIKDEDIYKVDYPTIDEALQIFCMYAFDQKNPHPGFKDLAKEVTELVGNLPLALEVTGSHFKQMSREVWEMELKNMKKTRLHRDILNILKFSYEALREEEKHLFNDISCFFNGDMIDRVEEIIGDDFSQRLRVLEKKSLIYTYDGMIGMHTLLTKLVWEDLQGCTILVDAQKICNALTYSTDNLAIRGINFNLSEIRHKLDVDERAFERMLSLEYLQICCSKNLDRPKLHVPQGLKFLPYKLKLLCWDSFPMKSMPSKFHPVFLVKLSMTHSKLEKLWEGNPPLGSLKEINLRASKNLKGLPNLSNATSLKRLDLGSCGSLEEIPSSIGNATNLEKMNLMYCFSLVKLPYSIGNLNKLKDLDMSGCSNLKAFPINLNSVSKLSVINSKLKRFHEIMCWSRLRKLSMAFYSRNVFPLVPDSIKHLDLSSTDIEEVSPYIQNLSPNVLPTNINLKSLCKLDLSGCTRLKTFPEISTSIEYLDLSDTAIEELPSSIWSWLRLLELNLNWCKSLKVFQPISDSNKQFPQLLQLHLYQCRNLVSLPQLPDSLSVLNAGRCTSLKRIQRSFHSPQICLNFGNCYKLSKEGRELIVISDFKVAFLPGKEVPSYFEHQAKGDFLTVNLDQRLKMTSKKATLPLFLRFKACLLLPHGDSNDNFDYYFPSFTGLSCHILCIQNDHVIGSGLCKYDPPLLEYAEDHLYFFVSSISLNFLELDVDHLKLEFQFKTDADIEIQQCGIHLEDLGVYDDHECEESADITIWENLDADTKRRRCNLRRPDNPESDDQMYDEEYTEGHTVPKKRKIYYSS